MTQAALSRAQVVQHFLDMFEDPRYLEIGVAEGRTFFALKAAKKTAVDPVFKFDPARYADPTTQFFAMPSDAWFAQAPARPMFEVINIDGLHTQEQTLRDLLNATERLAPDGVIIIDDVIPADPEAALPDQAACYEIREQQGNPSRAWMGDVFRLLYFIETFMQSWSFEIVSENHGQAVLWREPRDRVPERPLDSVARKSYEDLVTDMAPQRLPLATISERYASHRATLKPRMP